MIHGRAVVVASQKGGVGKTTLSLNLAYALARRGWRTLVVDADPQGSIGYSVQGSLHEQLGLADVLMGARDLASTAVATRLPEFALLPVGNVSPTEAFRWSADLENGERLAPVFEQARALYDVTIIDTPPTLGGITVGSLRCADFALLPLQAEPLAARSVRSLLSVLAQLREEGARLELAGMILTMLQSRREASLAVAQESWRLFPEDLIFDATIPRDDTFLAASAAGAPVALLHRRPPAVAAVFDQIAAELETKIGLEIDDEASIPLLG